MLAKDLRESFQRFFEKRGHTRIGSASLLPENDPTVLFTTAGMHPLVPYLSGQATHPGGQRLVNAQRCVRTIDIESVGDDSHLSFFEMLGNWSLGDYFKEEAISWSYQFLTSEDEGLGIDPAQLYVTCFAGDDHAPRDDEAAQHWRQLGIPEQRIAFLPRSDNWWGPAGQTGPCGPDTEIFYDLGEKDCQNTDCNPACSCGRWLEIWNNVFMEYHQDAEGKLSPLSQKNIDTGMGLERMICVLQGVNSVYHTELFSPMLEWLRGHATQRDESAERIIVDHVKTAVFMIMDGVSPSNSGQGYILRRLIRRAVRYGRELGLESPFVSACAACVFPIYGEAYPLLIKQQSVIDEELRLEEARFAETLKHGLAQFDKTLQGVQKGMERGGQAVISGKAAFKLYDTYGFPLELTVDLAKEHGLTVDHEGFAKALAKHKDVSRADGGSFKGGLADHSEETTRLHTATHLLHQALRSVLGEHVYQKGSNITPDRLRFDFSHPEKMTDDQKQDVESMVNQAIRDELAVSCYESSVDQAKNDGAIGVFDDRYGDKINVYRMGDFSLEICGGPHVTNTKELEAFKIIKEEASSRGVRRIRAVVGQKAKDKLGTA